MRTLLGGCVLLGLASCSMVGVGPTTPPDYVIFFTEKSSVLEPAAVSLIRRAANEALATPGSPVSVIGWTDSDGSPEADRVLSRQRAAAVAETLEADGVPSTRITRRGRGQTHEDRGIESRRVEIRVGY